MELWVIIEGEKAGPFQDYEIRRRIENGELAGDTPAWHQGQDGWKPLRELAPFAVEFERPTARNDGEAAAASAVRRGQGPPTLPQERLLGRRFWARWLDILAYVACWWLGLWASGRPIDAALDSLLLMVLQLVPWFVLETILLHRYGTTPGKWLLGLRVVNADGSLLSLGAATVRSLRVWSGGIGFGLGPVALICQAFSLHLCLRLGRPLWDHVGKHYVRATPLVPWRVAALAVGMFAAIQLQGAVVSPYLLKDMEQAFPALKEWFERYPPPRLPGTAAVGSSEGGTMKTIALNNRIARQLVLVTLGLALTGTAAQGQNTTATTSPVGTLTANDLPGTIVGSLTQRAVASKFEICATVTPTNNFDIWVDLLRTMTAQLLAAEPVPIAIPRTEDELWTVSSGVAQELILELFKIRTTGASDYLKPATVTLLRDPVINQTLIRLLVRSLR